MRRSGVHVQRPPAAPATARWVGARPMPPRPCALRPGERGMAQGGGRALAGPYRELHTSAAERQRQRSAPAPSAHRHLPAPRHPPARRRRRRPHLLCQLLRQQQRAGRVAALPLRRVRVRVHLQGHGGCGCQLGSQRGGDAKGLAGRGGPRAGRAVSQRQAHLLEGRHTLLRRGALERLLRACVRACRRGCVLM